MNHDDIYRIQQIIRQKINIFNEKGKRRKDLLNERGKENANLKENIMTVGECIDYLNEITPEKKTFENKKAQPSRKKKDETNFQEILGILNTNKNEKARKSLASQINFSRKAEYHTIDKDYMIIIICLLKDGRIAGGSTDKTIKIINLSTEKCDMVIEGHNDTILSLCTLDNGYLVSASRDKTIKIWEIKERFYFCIKVLEGHTEEVMKAIKLSNDRICSCSEDKTIKIWRGSNPYEIITTLEGHSKCVNSITELKDKKYIVSGSAFEPNIRFWNTSTYKCEKVIEVDGCSMWNSFIEMKDKRLLVGKFNGIAVISTETFEVLRMIEDYRLGFVNCFFLLNNGHIVCGCGNGYMYLLDGSFKFICQRKVHEGAYTNFIETDKNKIVSSSVDRKIIIYN